MVHSTSSRGDYCPTTIDLYGNPRTASGSAHKYTTRQNRNSEDTTRAVMLSRCNPG
jgi:hypothetical protein